MSDEPPPSIPQGTALATAAGGPDDRGVDLGVNRGVDLGVERGVDNGVERGVERGVGRGVEPL